MKTLNELHDPSHMAVYRQAKVRDVNFSSVNIKTIKAANNAVLLTATTTKGYDVVVAVSGSSDNTIGVFDRPVKISCTCPNYDHKYKNGNIDNECHFGNDLNLLSQDDTVGLCKHIQKALLEL